MNSDDVDTQRRSTLIALLVAVTFFANLDATVIATALPDIAKPSTWARWT